MVITSHAPYIDHTSAVSRINRDGRRRRYTVGTNGTASPRLRPRPRCKYIPELFPEDGRRLAFSLRFAERESRGKCTREFFFE